MTKKKRNILLVLGVVLLLVVIVVANLGSGGGKGIAVTAEQVKRGDILSVVTGTGKIQARRTVKISADVSAKIVELPVQEGVQVKRGDVLVRLDPARYEAAVGQARAAMSAARAAEKRGEASLLEARQTYTRAEGLYAGKLISDEDFTRYKVGLQVAEANLESARHYTEQQSAFLRERQDDLEKTIIRSPIDGKVISLNAEVGEIVLVGTMNNPGTVIMTVADLSTIEVEVEVDETDVAKVEIGQDATIEVDAIPDTTFRGRVTEVGFAAVGSGFSTTDRVTNFLVKVLLLDDVPQIRQGMTATTDITTARREGSLYVPIQAVVLRPEKIDTLQTAPEKEPEVAGVLASETNPVSPTAEKTEPKEVEGVFKIVDGLARFVPVNTGIADQQNIEVISGLTEGEEIITGSFRILRTLKDDDRVKIDKIASGDEKS